MVITQDFIRCSLSLRKSNIEGLSQQSINNSDLNGAFWFHLFITALAWVGPFLFSWYLMVTAYALVVLQFIFLGRCVLNKSHGLDAGNDATFYSVLLDWAKIKHDPVRVK